MVFRPFASFLSRLRAQTRPAKRVVTRVSVCEHLEDRVLLAVDAAQVLDIFTGTNGSGPRGLIDANGTLFFGANDGVAGYELWKSDGTAAGTTLVKDIKTGLTSSNLSSLTNVNGTVFFVANDGSSGAELWKSDGTAAGTVLVKDINSGAGDSNPISLTNVKGTLFFTAADGTGRELWKSDGTSAGTVQVKDVFAGSSSSYPSSLTDVNGTLYFSANDGTTGRELWKSDGTAEGTVEITDIRPGTNGSNPNSFTNVNGTLYFTAASSAGAYAFWKTDGTVAGTVKFKEIGASSGLYAPSYLTNFNGSLFFSARGTARDNQLWKSDGTTAGTVQIKGFAVAPYYPLTGLTNVNGTLFFSANGGVGDFEVWKSDGTSAGTVQVKDIVAGSASSSPQSLTNLNGKLYFTATDGSIGRELWKSDGTSLGTVPVKDLLPGASGANPANLTNVNGTLYFSATDGVTGSELWRLVQTNVNEAPTSLSLSASSISENNPVNAIVGTLSATDPDDNSTFTFSLIDGTGSTDNASFSIVDNVLRINPSTVFANQSSYSIRLQVADQGGLTFQKQFTISVIPANLTPTNIGLSATNIAENNAPNATIGTLSATASGTGNTFTYSLVAGTGGTDNDSFVINGNSLQIVSGTDFETKSNYSIRIKVANQVGQTFEKQFTINVTDVNEAPTDVSLSSASIAENNPANAVVGQLIGVDPDSSNTFTYSLVTGTGSADNASFTIVGNTLTITPIADFEMKSTYAIRVQVVDQGGQAFQKPLTIAISNVNEAPSLSTIADHSILEDATTGILPFTIGDPETPAGTLTVTATSSNTALVPNESLTISGTGANRSLVIAPTANQNGSATITITVSDGTLTTTRSFQVTVQSVDDPPLIGLSQQPQTFQIKAKKPVSIDSGATISDNDTPNLVFTGSVLQVSGHNAKDTLSILNQGGIHKKGKTVLSGSTVIGNVSGGKKGAALTIHLSSGATQVSVQNLLRSIGFKSSDKVAGNRAIKVQITNIGGNNTNLATRQIQLVP